MIWRRKNKKDLVPVNFPLYRSIITPWRAPVKTDKMTDKNQQFPNFIDIGAMKAATTWIFQCFYRTSTGKI
ncbi:MAG: hypothetical protein ACOCVY_00150 [Patescibacteria group bacterium]